MATRRCGTSCAGDRCGPRHRRSDRRAVGRRGGAGDPAVAHASRLDAVARALGEPAQSRLRGCHQTKRPRGAFERAARGFRAGRYSDQQCRPGASSPLPHRAPEELVGSMLAVNLTGTYHGIRAALAGHARAPIRTYRQRGQHGRVRGYAYVAAYCAAKHGVIGLTRALALEVAQRTHRERRCPGYTETDLVRRCHREHPARSPAAAPRRRERRSRAQSAGPSYSSPTEVAHAVAWLCLPGSEAITGQSIAIAGGEVM